MPPSSAYLLPRGLRGFNLEAVITVMLAYVNILLHVDTRHGNFKVYVVFSFGVARILRNLCIVEDVGGL